MNSNVAAIAAAITAVKLLTDISKAVAWDLKGRATQVLVLVLSVAAAGVFCGYSNPLQFVMSVAAIFSGAVATDQVLKKEV
jgi:polyferredoxin